MTPIEELVFWTGHAVQTGQTVAERHGKGLDTISAFSSVAMGYPMFMAACDELGTPQATWTAHQQYLKAVA